MEHNRLYDFWTLVFPLVNLNIYFMLKYATIKYKYMELRGKTNPYFKRSKQYRRYKKKMDLFKVLTLK